MFLTNIRSIFNAITCEPVLFMYFTALALSQVSAQNFLLQKACHIGDVVPSPTATCPDEISAQKHVTEIQTWKDLVTLFGPVLFVLFAGPWSDNHGKNRKPLMWLPVFGQIISDVLSILNIYFWNWSPEVAALCQSIPSALTGWRSCFLIGVNSYICDISPVESRTVRAGIVSALYFIGSPIGSALFGFIFHDVGFYGVFLVCVVININALWYLQVFVEESDPDKLKECKLKFYEGLINPKQAVQSFKTINKAREGYKRAVILLVVFLAPITMAPLQGEYAILLFYLRYKFNWNEVDFGYYAAYKCVVIFCGTVVTTAVFSKMMAISDAVIGVMASVTLVLASVGFTFASSTWELFVYPLVDFMHGAGLAVVYSILSKNVEDIEIGQANSMIGVADALFPLVNMPLYNQIYNKTFTTSPGAVFLLSTFYGAVAFFVFGLIYVLQRLQKSSEEEYKEKTKL